MHISLQDLIIAPDRGLHSAETAGEITSKGVFA